MKKFKYLAFALLILANFTVFVGNSIATGIECDISTPVFDWASGCNTSGSNCFKVRCTVEE